MSNIINKGTDADVSLDLETCSLEELKAELSRLDFVIDYYGGSEQSAKTLINSIYGATGNPAYDLYNPHVSESTTLQGRQLTRFASKCIETFFRDLFPKMEELHRKLGIDSEKAKTLDITKIPKRIVDGAEASVLEAYSDTDSVTGDSIIKIKAPQFGYIEIPIETLWEDLIRLQGMKIEKRENGSMIIDLKQNGSEKYEYKTYAFDKERLKLVEKRINYIYKHKTKKHIFRIKSKSGKEVVVTEDHSIEVMRGDKILSVKPKDININTDKIITIK